MLWFGTVRDYKGVDTLLEAFREVEGAELWIVGKPEIPMQPLHELARPAPGRVRFVERFVPDPELASYLRRADLVALPYRNIDQSGVLFSALAFGKPIVMTRRRRLRRGGRGPRRRAARAARGPGRARGRPQRAAGGRRRPRARWRAAAARAAAGPYSWDRIGRQTLDLYESLL